MKKQSMKTQTVANTLNRRDFLKTGVAVGGALGAASLAGLASAQSDEATVIGSQSPGFNRLLSPAPIPEAKGARVVIVGGGWSGLTMARYLTRYDASLDVVLIDQNDHFVSCPLSNTWLADQVGLEFLTHSYVTAAHNNGYLFLHAAAVDLDRESRKLFTTLGSVDYDYLVLAPGIDYDYERIGVEDPDTEYALRMNYPGGFMGASEWMLIKEKLHSFQGGTLALTVPAGNYRCMAAPYERACMAAAILKKRDIKANILLLDMNPDIRIKADGFKNAFEEFYSGMIDYQPSSEIAGVNVQDKVIETGFDEFPFDDAIIYPPVRASRLIENFGLNDPDSMQREPAIDPFKYHLIGDEHVYVTGDSRSQPFSKSANTAHSEAKYVAEVVSAHAKGKEVAWRSPQTMCFSSVTIDPLEAMSIIAFYKYDEEESSFAFDRVHMTEKWNSRAGQAGFAWAEGLYKDMFYS